MRLSDIPLIDNHCHPMHRVQALGPQAYRSYFSESSDPSVMAEHAHRAAGYMSSLGLMAELLGIPRDSSEEEVLAARTELGLAGITRLAIERSNTAAVVMDHGFPVDAALSYDETEDVLREIGCPMRRIWRLEMIFERLVTGSESLRGVVAALTDELSGMRAKGVSGLKSVAAYRSGLAIQPTTEAEASAAFEADRRSIDAAPGSYRIESKPLEDYLVRIALKMAAEQEIPVQFHTAFGDTDADMLSANPLVLRPVLEDAAFRSAPIVMLHCFPFVAEVAYLAHVYANAYFDLSYTVPVSGSYALRVYEDALSIAPASKILYGSDAPGIPDFFWLGGVVHRRSLGRVLDGWIADGLTTFQAEEIARSVSYRNAAGLYGIDLPGDVPASGK